MEERSTLKIFSSKYFLWPVSVLSVIFIAVIGYFAGIEDKTVFPDSQQFGLVGYTDSIDGGNTQILEQTVTDSKLTFRFQLREGFFSPYAGVSIMPSDRAQYIDVSQYNQISLCLSGKGIDRLGLGVYTPLPDEQKISLEDENLHHSYLTISDKEATYHIPLNQLKHPEWWEDLHQISESKKSKPDLSRILHINLGSAYVPEIEEEKTLEVYSIAFTRNNSKLWVILGTSYIAFVVLLFGLRYGRTYQRKKKEEVTVSYKPVEVTEISAVNEEECIAYINQHFHNNELSLDLVAKEIGISQRKITGIINERFSCNFKTYINRIRIHEAQRLLTETELNIGEIAYKVGYNNQSHFNRVFKAEVKISPSEYRDNQ
ncbi:AraC family transcriptional regulator [Limibacter armeniacum]|uniref:helix-turn-helix domain-containing protein n=1 Tax=Limibacter armeniacum TaxID=466084 RepID=UPI002FE5A423